MAGRIGGAAGKRSAPKSSPRAAPASDRKVAKSDNADAIEAADQAQAISIVHLLMEKDKLIKPLQAQIDAIRAEKTEIFGRAKNMGHSRKALTEIITDLNVKGPRRNLRDDEEKRAKLRRWFGLPVGEEEKQLEMMPEEKRDEHDFEADGYRAGVAGLEGKPPPEVPVRFVQAWMKGWHNGQKSIAESMVEAAKPRPTIGQQAAADFKADNPDVDMSPEAIKARERAEERRVKESLENLGKNPANDGPGEIVDDDPLGVNGDGQADHTEGEMAAGVIHEPGTNGVDDGAGPVADPPPLTAEEELELAGMGIGVPDPADEPAEVV